MAVSSLQVSRAGPASGVPPTVREPPAASRARGILALIGDRWSLLVIYALADAGTLRFGALRRRAPAISPRVLTLTLRTLERDGLASRTVDRVVPLRVEYALTPLGRAFRDAVRPLIEWASAHAPDIEAARARYDRRAQGPSVGASGVGALASGVDAWREARPEGENAPNNR